MASTTKRPAFEPVDTSVDSSSRGDDVESPSLSNSNALARFEFEPGRSKDGTKVLMVEWQEDESSRAVTGDWEISWEGKKATLPAKDQPQRSNVANAIEPVNRIYFLLIPDVPVPTTIHLRKGDSIAWKTCPLPAIFSAQLGASASEAGKKGVLHTRWAKKRLQVLQNEIDQESAHNAEGIGLEMAMAEKEWIEQNFGVLARPGNIAINVASGAGVPALNSPTSPRSPGGGRLAEIMNGLKLGTSDRELNTPISTQKESSLFSPDGNDIAIGASNFSQVKGNAPATSTKPAPAKFVAQQPPTSFLAQQQQSIGGSLNAAFSDIPFNAPTPFAPGAPSADDDDDDLFALPMSPRSPKMTKSPFSFAAQDVGRYAKSERA